VGKTFTAITCKFFMILHSSWTFLSQENVFYNCYLTDRYYNRDKQLNTADCLVFLAAINSSQIFFNL